VFQGASEFECFSEIDKNVRPKGTWENNIKMYLKETGCEDIGCIKLAQNKDQWRSLTNTVANFWVP
jgi:hypothetical protein